MLQGRQRRGLVSRHEAFLSGQKKSLTLHDGFLPETGAGNKKKGENLQSEKAGERRKMLTGNTWTGLCRHESFLSEKEKTFLRTREPLLGRRVSHYDNYKLI